MFEDCFVKLLALIERKGKIAKLFYPIVMILRRKNIARNQDVVFQTLENEDIIRIQACDSLNESKWLMNRFILNVFAVLCILMSADVSAQTYSRFYSDSNIIAKIEKQGYKSNCGVDREHLYIRLKGNTPVVVSGYIKIRFTECNGGESYTEEYFSETVTTYNSSYPFEVNDYYNPNNKHGNYETVGFYIDAITPVGGTYQDTSGDYYDAKQYFSKTTRFNAKDKTNRRCVIYNPDGTCEDTGEMLVDGYWVKGVAKGVYHIVGQKIYVCWENMINHEYQLNSDFASYTYYGLKYMRIRQ